MTLVLGSPLYMAPELVKKEVYDYKVDIWAVSVITYVLLSGAFPFFDTNWDAKTIDNKITTKDPEFKSSLFRGISKEVINFIKRGLKKDP